MRIDDTMVSEAFQEAASGYGKLTIPIIYLVHYLGDYMLFPFTGKEERLLKILTQVGDFYSHQPHCLLQPYRIEYMDGGMVDLHAFACVPFVAYLLSKGMEIRISQGE